MMGGPWTAAVGGTGSGGAATGTAGAVLTGAPVVGLAFDVSN